MSTATMSLEEAVRNLPVTDTGEEVGCDLCGKNIDWRVRRSGGTRCDGCSKRAEWAVAWNRTHFKIPRRYEGLADVTVELAAGSGYLLIGSAGTGKTYRGYALLERQLKVDPRLTMAAYSWPEVLLELRRSYNLPADQHNAAREMIDGLRKSDVVLIDDIGAEKITEGNSAWLRETLYVILNTRHDELRQTLLTSNLGTERLREYLGDSILSRIGAMCKIVEVVGGDRRLN